MAISDYEKTIYNMRSVPLKRTKEVEERLMTALAMANAQLGSIIGRTDNPLSIGVYQGKRMKVVQMMNELGISLKRDITSAISEVTNDVAFTEQDATNDLLLEHDDANLMVDFTEIPRQTADLLAQRYDVDGLRISSSIWAQSQVSEIENVVLSGIARGQSARDMSNQLSQFMLGGGTGMGTSVRAKAMRLARTEINNAYWESARRASIESPVVLGIRWELSGRHPEYDVCNLLAGTSLFGLGKGGYPPEYLPAKPHPNCLCYQTDILRNPKTWDKPKSVYDQKELEDALHKADTVSIPQSVAMSPAFKKRQKNLFSESINNVVRPFIPITTVPTVLPEVPALPPDSPVAKVYDLMLKGGEGNAERMKLGLRRKIRSGGEAVRWEHTMTDTEIGEAVKLGQRLQSDEVKISVNFPIGDSKILPAMIKNGRSKNLFETGKGLGHDSKEERSEWESDMVAAGSLGDKDEAMARSLYKKMPAKQKPSYGALNLGDDPKGAASVYGSAWFELENHVKDRSTFTPGNSSNRSDGNGITTFKNAETFFQYEEGRKQTGNVSSNKASNWGYVEVQIWNGIDFKKDVKAVHVRAEDIERSEKKRAFIELKGLKKEGRQINLLKDLQEFADKFDVEIVVHENEGAK